MSGTKSSRTAAVKRDGSLRYATRHTPVEKSKRSNQHKETNRTKSCDCLQKADNGKNSKLTNTKLALKKSSNKSLSSKNSKSKSSSTNHREKVVIVSKRSSSVSVVKSCKLRKSVSVKKVSYSTSVVLSSDEDTDSDEDSEDEKEEEEQTQKTKTVLKRTTSKVKSTEKKSERKTQTKSSQKAKAIKLLCEKLSDKHKDPNRELRPRFPYSMLQEIPTARSHRMASLNALAKVHVLYENEGRSVGENLNDADESSLIDFLNENSDEEEVKKSNSKTIVKKESKQSTSVNDKKTASKKVVEEKTKKEKIVKKNKSRVAKPVQKRKRKKKMPEVEIIDTRICKRMASLNAQAILAASYLHEPKRKRSSKSDDDSDSSETDDDDYEDDDKDIFLESNCDLKIIESEDKEETIKIKEQPTNSNKQKNEKGSVIENLDENVNSSYKTPISEIRSNWSVESDVAVSETRTSRATPLSVSSTSTKVGVTQYTEVTKVHINTCQESEIKEETKSERNIEHIISNDDVAITQMYHYQSKNSNESYCVQMQTTYKPGSKSITPPSVALSPNNPIHKHLSDTVLPSGHNYYGGPSHSSLMPPQPYHMAPNMGPMPPALGMEHRVPRQYGGSAFTVPHYRQTSQGQYPRNEYGYYQPAGPLIQPTSDQLTIHKPVPYHPQPNLHQPPQPPSSNRSSYQNFPSHHSSSSITSRPSQAPHRQKHIVSACPPPLEILPPQPKHPRYSRSRPNEGIPSRGYGSQSFNEASKRESSTHSYATQNAPSYPKHKTEPNAYERYSRPYEQKDQLSRNNFSSTSVAYNAPHQNITHKSNHLPSPESVRAHDSRLGHTVSRSDIHHHSTSISDNSGYKNLHEMVNSKEKSWGVRDNQSISTSPSNMTQYPQESRKIPPVEISDSTGYPVRPPSVIEIIDEIPRDTKTYIQLEVPKNSHREKIVVVDVENDEIEQKEKLQEKAEVISPPIAPIIKPIQEDEKEVIIKIEEKPIITANEEHKSDVLAVGKSLEGNSQSDVTILEVKKKKESAVVRRARLHGKQRTFRDCYNRPLAQLSKSKKIEEVNISEDHTDKKFQPLVSLPRLVLPKVSDKKPAHGWSWEGPAQDKLVYVSNDSPPCFRKCYPTIRHTEGDVISVRDSVFLRSGPKKTDLPFVAKITALWEEPSNGEMNMSLLWYYRPEHTDTGKKISYADDEIFASKHRDTNSVACIEDKCYVLTYAEYCRYKKRCKFMNDDTCTELSIVPDGDESCKIRNLPPINISPDLVLFSRKVYDYRQKRLLKNPV